jgi:hypothetical protein
MRAANWIVGLRLMTRGIVGCARRSRYGGASLHLMARRNAGSGTAPTTGRVGCGSDNNQCRRDYESLIHLIHPLLLTARRVAGVSQRMIA